MKILLASNNQKKLKELKEILNSTEVVTLSEAGIVSAPEETGKTFEENALLKATAGFRASGLPCIADDSGLCVEALNGAPGVYSARYSGDKATDFDNNALLLKNMANEKNRSAKFVCAIAFVSEDYIIETKGECKGELLYSPKGEGGFGYDPLFYVKEYNKTFAELLPEEKNSISHRAKALKNFLEKYKFRKN